MRVLVTGSGGFIGKNLVVRLQEIGEYEPILFDRRDSLDDLRCKVNQADAVIHLAGVNRPKDLKEFSNGNYGLTLCLCNYIEETGRKIPLIFSSSIQADLLNPYGQSKLEAENLVASLSRKTAIPVRICRLPNVFGKWCKPNYNSVVATFCHNIANDLPIQINDPETKLTLVYIDDVVDQFIRALRDLKSGLSHMAISPEYTITVGALAKQVEGFRNGRTSLITDRVGVGLVRALYATYMSYLPPKKFFYDLPKYGDERGLFVEMLKTQDSGQFSFFTAHPGVTRGGHYHHTKTEKFLVIKGVARFRFRHLLTNELYEMSTTGDKPQVVETIPGWVHDVTNIGDGEMVVMLWANEIFDRKTPDTIANQI